MCTVSWSLREQGHRLYFNRDESRSRPRASAPRMLEWNGVDIVAPIDPQGGGSWIALNGKGEVAFLLNNYAAMKDSEGSRDYCSRGEIPLKLAACGDERERLDAIRESGSDRYRPFHIGVLIPGEKAVLYSWDGFRLEQRTPDLPFLSTSSYRSEEVQFYRRTRFQEFFPDGNTSRLWEKGLKYHCDRIHEDPAFNPAMSREDAETHCLSRVTVTSERFEFEYWERDTSGNGFDFVNSVSFGGGCP
jgi:hypothetical protein